MGTAISVEIAGAVAPKLATAMTEQAFAWFRSVDSRFSTYKDDSEVSRFARGELAADVSSPGFREVLCECSRLWDETQGYFDVYAGGSYDPSGYVKGWSVQVASDRLLAAGIVDHCINAGGDVRVHGRTDSGELWRVGIRHPWESTKLAWVLESTNLAVATSGTYERGLHVINPRTGKPADQLCSVTVSGPDLGVADAYATAAMAMGEAGLQWLASLAGYQSSAVTVDGRAYVSDGWRSVA
ncbi:FAD:protein FMN transferase [Catelliglobosispora koreensis]|uniref:FAD:protein FMN transferase n=1 Tax=Catelliglobosispora koreensis TaxID=129052 RepID=UPI00035C1EB5